MMSRILAARITVSCIAAARIVAAHTVSRCSVRWADRSFGERASESLPADFCHVPPVTSVLIIKRAICHLILEGRNF